MGGKSKYKNGFSSNTTRIAKNTIFLYFRQILIMLVSLYTVRVVLNVLGAEDYGIYNVVAGVVTMFSFLSGAMASASQRYFSFDLGKGDTEHLKITFNITFEIYLLLAILIVILAETFGLYFVHKKLVIPPERMMAAKWIYQLSIFSLLMSLITTPYMAIIIAHEKMSVYAYVSIIEVSLKVGIVFLLKVLPYDKLIVYGILLAIVSFINTSIYRFYCYKNYSECKFLFVKDKKLFKELISYSSWNLFGSVASMVRNQGLTILLNLFFGPLINASRAVAMQVNVAVLSFAQNFSTALRPQIIKSYAANEKERTIKLVLYGTKIVFFLMAVICVPLFFQVPYLLKLWLKNVPDYTVIFVQLVIIDVLIDSISYPIMSVVQATGKIKLYQSVVGGCLILNLPASYIFLKVGFPPETVFVVAIIFSFITLILRVVISQRLLLCNLILPFTKLILLFLGLTILSCIIPLFLINKLNENFLEFCLFVIISVVWSGLILFLFGLNKEEKKLVLKIRLGEKNE